MNLYDDNRRSSGNARGTSSRATASRGGTSSRKAPSSRGASSSHGTSARSSQSRGSARSTGYSSGSRSSSGRRSARRRKPRRNYKMIAIGGVALILIILAIALAAKGCGNGTGKTEGDGVTVESLGAEVTVDGVSITGMSQEQARAAILANYSWGMKVTYDGDTYEVENLIGDRVDQLLEEIFHGTEPQSSYSLDTAGMEELVQAQVEAMAAKWDKPARNGEISGFDKETNTFIYSGEENGVVIDREKLAEDMMAAISGKDFSAVIAAKGQEVRPEITEAEAKDLYQVIGQYSTTTTANKDRNTNIKLASECLEGKIIQPGETFSFNDTTGPRSESKGYKPAGAYLDGKLVEEPGGGVCQVSSTLYNAVVFAGLKTTERHAHSFEPSYVTPGEDAAVSYGGPDMKFVNNSDTAVALRAKLEGSISGRMKLTVSVVGIPILEDGVTYSMHSEKVSELDPPAPEYVEDLTLPPHTEKVIKQAENGSRWTTNLVIKKNGEVISDELLHNSSYKGHAAVIHRNETDEQVTEEGESTTESLNPDMTVPTIDGETSPVSTDSPSSSGSQSSQTSGTQESKPAPTTAEPPSAPAPVDNQAPGSQDTPAAGSPVITPHPEQTVAPQEGGPGV